MGNVTGIAWTDSTINCWHGCDKVSAGCKHCYAEVSTPVRVKRAKGLELWGADAARQETKSWEANLRKWNREALASGKPRRVFGQSLSDTFEDYHGGRVLFANGEWDAGLDRLRDDFLSVVEECSALTFQLLTKRPENVLRMVPQSWRERWPGHVWIGCTVESQKMAEERIPHMLRIPARVRFLSCEPLLEEVDLSDLVKHLPDGSEEHIDALHCDVSAEDDEEYGGAAVSWVIVGGESGTKARAFDVTWARSIVKQCKAAGVACFVKQMGASPVEPGAVFGTPMPVYLDDSHGGDPSEWPEDLRVREFPAVPT